MLRFYGTYGPRGLNYIVDDEAKVFFCVNIRTLGYADIPPGYTPVEVAHGLGRARIILEREGSDAAAAYLYTALITGE